MKKDTWLWILAMGFIAVSITGGGILMATVSPLVKKFAEAVGNAEGFNTPGSRSNRNNNPGDITRDITHTAVGSDGTYMIYATPEDGWNALYHLVSMMFSGTSGFYKPTMSISQIAQIYSPDGWYNWANNVANYLGVSTDTTLNQLQGTV